jgi:hypothetical protein
MFLSSSVPGEDGPPVPVTGERKLTWVNIGRKEAIADASKEDERKQVRRGRRQAIAIDEGIRSGANVDNKRRRAPLTWEEEGEMKTKGRERRTQTKMKYKYRNQSLAWPLRGLASPP